MNGALIFVIVIAILTLAAIVYPVGILVPKAGKQQIVTTQTVTKQQQQVVPTCSTDFDINDL